MRLAIKNIIVCTNQSYKFSISRFALLLSTFLLSLSAACSNPPPNVLLDEHSTTEDRSYLEMTITYMDNGKINSVSRKYSCTMFKEAGFDAGEPDFTALEFPLGTNGGIYIPKQTNHSQEICFSDEADAATNPEQVQRQYLHFFLWADSATTPTQVIPFVYFSTLNKRRPEIRSMKIKLLANYRGKAIKSSSVKSFAWVQHYVQDGNDKRKSPQNSPFDLAVFTIARITIREMPLHPLALASKGKPTLFTICDAVRYSDIYDWLIEYDPTIANCGLPSIMIKLHSDQQIYGVIDVPITYDNEKNFWKLPKEQEFGEMVSYSQSYDNAEWAAETSRRARVEQTFQLHPKLTNFMVADELLTIKYSIDPKKRWNAFYDPVTGHLYIADIWVNTRKSHFELPDFKISQPHQAIPDTK
jgi:hypothetical protein